MKHKAIVVRAIFTVTDMDAFWEVKFFSWETSEDRPAFSSYLIFIIRATGMKLRVHRENRILIFYIPAITSIGPINIDKLTGNGILIPDKN